MLPAHAQCSVRACLLNSVLAHVPPRVFRVRTQQLPSVCPGAGSVPGAVRGVDEHGAGAGAAALQPAARRRAGRAAGDAARPAGAGPHVRRARAGLLRHDRRQGP